MKPIAAFLCNIKWPIAKYLNIPNDNQRQLLFIINEFIEATAHVQNIPSKWSLLTQALLLDELISVGRLSHSLAQIGSQIGSPNTKRLGGSKCSEKGCERLEDDWIRYFQHSKLRKPIHKNLGIKTFVYIKYTNFVMIQQI